MTPSQIKAIRVSLGLNVSDMASVIGVHRNTYVKWESGENTISAAPRRSIRIIVKAELKGLFEELYGEYL